MVALPRHTQQLYVAFTLHPIFWGYDLSELTRMSSPDNDDRLQLVLAIRSYFAGSIALAFAIAGSF